MRRYRPSQETQPYGKHLAERGYPGGHTGQVLVNASLTLIFTKTREMRHEPLVVRAWLDRRIRAHNERHPRPQ